MAAWRLSWSRGLGRRVGELAWAAPFACLGLFALALLRPEPLVPPAPVHGRVVTDVRGARVEVPLRVRAVFYGSAYYYLEMTHAPATLVHAGAPDARDGYAKGVIGRAFPSVAANPALWRARPGTFEGQLADDRGYTYFVFDPRPLRRMGLNAVSWLGGPGLFRDPDPVPAWGGMEMGGWDREVINGTAIINRALGQDGLGDWLIADYAAGYRALAEDLKPKTLESRPRALTVLSSRDNWSNLMLMGGDGDSVERRRTGVRGASEGFRNTGRQQEVERILAMDPDIIVTSEPVDDFLRDPRWRGLEAVRARRVYNGPGDFPGGEPLIGLTYNALWARWIAEIAHPDRMPASLRGRLRDHVLKLYGYRLSEAEIDQLLRVEANRHAAGYARFTAAYRPAAPPRPGRRRETSR